MDVTHVSTDIKGSAGYVDPEYLQTHQLTDKSDVYSFGILLIELVTGRNPIERKREPEERITAKWVWHTGANNLNIYICSFKTVQLLDRRRLLTFDFL